MTEERVITLFEVLDWLKFEEQQESDLRFKGENPTDCVLARFVKSLNPGETRTVVSIRSSSYFRAGREQIPFAQHDLLVGKYISWVDGTFRGKWFSIAQAIRGVEQILEESELVLELPLSPVLA